MIYHNTLRPLCPLRSICRCSDPVPDPGWAKDRRFLTGFFLVEEAADQTAAKQPSSVNLEIYPTEIQESLCTSHGWVA